MRAQRDGIHLVVENTTERVLTASAKTSSRYFGVGGDPRPGVSAFVWNVPPGILRFGCFEWTAPKQRPLAPLAEIRVVDPDRFWTPPLRGCRLGAHATIDYVAGTGGAATPEQAVDRMRARDKIWRRVLRGAPRRVGYPQSRAAFVRLVSGGRVTAVARVYSDDDGRWLVGHVDDCQR